MRIAAFVLGLISGIIGLGLAFFTLFVGGIASALASDHTVGVMGILAIILTLLIIVFSSIILAKPKQSGILLIGTSIGSIIAGGTFVAISSVLALVAGILAYVAGRQSGILPVKKAYVVWIISLLIAIIPISIVSKASTVQKTATAEDSINLNTATIDDISSKGTLYETFEIGGDSTDLQRQNLAEQIKGKVVEWNLPVYEVSKTNSSYRIQTGSSNKDISTFIDISPTTSEEIQYLNSLKTGDMISVKGYIKDVSFRSLNLSPAMLMSNKQAVNNTVNEDSNQSSNTNSAEQVASTDSQNNSSVSVAGTIVSTQDQTGGGYGVQTIDGETYHICYLSDNDDKIINQLSELENQHAKVTINGALVDKMAFNCNSVTINE